MILWVGNVLDRDNVNSDNSALLLLVCAVCPMATNPPVLSLIEIAQSQPPQSTIPSIWGRSIASQFQVRFVHAYPILHRHLCALSFCVCYVKILNIDGESVRIGLGAAASLIVLACHQ